MLGRLVKFLTLCGGVWLANVAPAFASPITLSGDTANSTSGLGNFTGTLTYTDINATHAQLTISLTNTSPAANGGFLTGFLLNNPSNSITGIPSVSFTDAAFKPMLGSIDGAPFGHFGLGASLGGKAKSNFGDGGSPNSGLGVGQSGTFTFNLTGTNLNALSEADFLAALSGPPGDGMGDKFFAARFRGFLNGGSDKVPAMGGTSNNPPPPPGGNPPPGGGGGDPPVPEPLSVMAWMVCGAALLPLRRRK